MRGTGMSRVDVFSDVVFAFALVLLAVSLTIPKNLQALHQSALAVALTFVSGSIYLWRNRRLYLEDM